LSAVAFAVFCCTWQAANGVGVALTTVTVLNSVAASEPNEHDRVEPAMEQFWPPAATGAHARPPPVGSASVRRTLVAVPAPAGAAFHTVMVKATWLPGVKRSKHIK